MNYKSHNGFCFLPSLVAAIAGLFFGAASLADAAQTTLAWDANSEADVVGYQVHYGAASGSYTRTVDVGNRTEATITDLTTGATYYFVVTAYNSAGLESHPSNEAYAEFPDIANEAPIVNLTSPQSGSSFVKRSQVSLTASASDSDGAVSRVEFFVAGAKVAEDTASPYAAVWVPAEPGSYEVVARAIDDKGLATASSVVTVKVTNTTVKGGGGSSGGGGSKKTTTATYSSLIESTEPTIAYAGTITVTTTSEDTYSGKITQDGVTYPIKGRLDANGRASLVIPRAGKSPLTLTLEATEEGIVGSITDGKTPGTFVARKATGPGSPKTAPAGRWIVLLAGPQAADGESAFPQGTGFGTLVVSKNGSTRFSGRLADGTPFSQGGKLTEGSALPLYVTLYKKRGTLAGEVQLPIDSEESSALSGSAEWYKPVGLPAQKYYPAGFRIPLEIYGELKTGLTQSKAGSTNARSAEVAEEITLFGGNLAEPISQRLTGPAAPGEHQLSISIRPSGKFTGSFYDSKAAKVRRFVGATLPTLKIGGGFFLGNDESGGVVVGPAN